ncbi:hypothetical protein A2U01_0076036, partial [Trifolium medium]|nr:hypothetical protein [Trifolium medium]
KGSNRLLWNLTPREGKKDKWEEVDHKPPRKR